MLLFSPRTGFLPLFPSVDRARTLSRKGHAPAVALLNNQAKREDIMSYYEVVKKIQKQQEMEKYLEAIRNATAELERMIHNEDGENG